MVDEKIWKTKDMYLAVVDKFNDQPISAYVTPSSKFENVNPSAKILVYIH